MAFYDQIYAADGSLKMLVNGAWKESTSGKTVSIANPSKEGVTAFKVQGEEEGEARSMMQEFVALDGRRAGRSGAAEERTRAERQTLRRRAALPRLRETPGPRPEPPLLPDHARLGLEQSPHRLKGWRSAGRTPSRVEGPWAGKVHARGLQAHPPLTARNPLLSPPLIPRLDSVRWGSRCRGRARAYLGLIGVSVSSLSPTGALAPAGARGHATQESLPGPGQSFFHPSPLTAPSPFLSPLHSQPPPRPRSTPPTTPPRPPRKNGPAPPCGSGRSCCTRRRP